MHRSRQRSSPCRGEAPMNEVTPAEQLLVRADELFREHQDRICRRTDRIFACLLLLQWVASLAGALWLSPSSWSGTTQTLHPHVWLALFLGGGLCSLPVL